MPEGHAIHRAARDQVPLFVGQKLTVVAPDGRHTAEAEALDGRTLLGIEAVGKHLFYRFDGPPPNVLHVHLALFGKFRLHELTAAQPRSPEPRGAVRYRLSTFRNALDLCGSRTANLLSAEAISDIKARLGPDPLDPKADAEKVFTRINKSVAPIATLLMNQQVISGIGNIYRAEILFRQSIHPLVKGRDLGRERFDQVWADAVELLKIGVRYGKIITVSREHAKKELGKTFSKLNGHERFYIYKHDACPFTGGPVETFELAGRTVYFSPKWQGEGP